MKKMNRNILLLEEIKKGMIALKKIEQFYREYNKKSDFKKYDIEKAIIVSEIMTNYYTCLETIFLRISQHFENKLDGRKWHQDLLRKMALDISGIRIRVVSEQTYFELLEFLKFRHFKRYYFDFNYDWEKIGFLRKKFHRLFKLIRVDLKEFISFIKNSG